MFSVSALRHHERRRIYVGSSAAARVTWSLSQALPGDVRQITERIWLVSFMDYDLGYFDDETCRLEPIENPFGAKVLTMSHRRNELSPMCPEWTQRAWRPQGDSRQGGGTIRGRRGLISTWRII
jgi:hypothetical protein